MSLLITYILLTLLATLWIAKDIETIYIFDVFGKTFQYVWFESGQRWTHVFTYGWRLAALCSLVILNGFLSYRIYALNPFEFDPAVQLIMFAVLLAASFAPIPWIYIAHRLRWQRQVRSTAQRLAGSVNLPTFQFDLARTLDRADYDTDEPWTAWHPKEDEWKSNGMWDGLVPVVYFRYAPPQSALFTIDWKTFLAWNIPVECVRVGNELPVHGDYESSFCVKCVRPIRSCPNWWMVCTELRSELDAVIEGRG